MQADKQRITPALVVGSSPCPLHVLVVEDSKANQLMIKLMLNKMGHIVVLADDGADAVEKARGGGLDLILMDVQMPNLDGLAATAMIRRQGGECSRVPILALTGNELESDRLACLQAGMDDVVTKPIERKLLQQKLASIVHR